MPRPWRIHPPTHSTQPSLRGETQALMSISTPSPGPDRGEYHGVRETAPGQLGLAILVFFLFLCSSHCVPPSGPSSPAASTVSGSGQVPLDRCCTGERTETRVREHDHIVRCRRRRPQLRRWPRHFRIRIDFLMAPAGWPRMHPEPIRCPWL